MVLTGVLALLSFVTGPSNLSQPSVALNGPLAGVLPAAVAPNLAQFGGVAFAFLLGLATAGLQRRKRLAWLAAVVVVLALTFDRREQGHTSVFGHVIGRLPEVQAHHDVEPPGDD